MYSFDHNLFYLSGFFLAGSVAFFYYPLAGLLFLIFSFVLAFDRILWFHPCDIIFVPFFISGLLRIAFKKIKPFAGRKIVFYFFPFFAALIISAALGPEPFKFKGQIYLWLQIPFTYIIALNLIKTFKQLKFIIYSMIASGFILAVLYICIQYPFNFFLDQPYSLGHNLMATVFGFCLFLILGSLTGQKKKNHRNILFISVAIVFVSMILTTSRWGIATFLFSVFIFINFALKKDRLKINSFMFSLLCGSLLLFVPLYFFYPDFFDRFQLKFYNLWFRMEIFHSALLFIRQHPLKGIGLGYFFSYTYLNHAHNIFLQIMVEAGLIGLVSFVFFILAAARYFIQKIRKFPEFDRPIFYAVSGCFLFFLLQNMLDFTLDRGIGIQIGLLLAIMDLST
ncbi:MAG: O-antigen ligase family protein, partial [Candidatus Omnitrophica bacterium]|nr:O-antigen ligase family protein [Candidatus Omnitrophota bacterium]